MHHNSRWQQGAAAALAWLMLTATPLAAHEQKHPPGHEESAGTPQRVTGANVTLHDLELLDQDGRRLRFASEAIGERVVVIEFFYTTCTTICPVTTVLLGQARERLGARFGRDVAFVSISVNPTVDTPQRLKAYARDHGAGDGWLWLTGHKASVDRVLTGLGAYTADFTDHPSMILVGDGLGGRWTRLFGLPGPEEILAEVERLLATRQQSADGTVQRLQE